MRMWLTDPALMCRKHLMGEHLEMHMFMGSMVKGLRMTGYIEANLLEPESLQSRHDALAAEMLRRGYRHLSPMGDNWVAEGLSALDPAQRAHRIDREAAQRELLSRCPECRKLHEEADNDR